MAAGVFAFCSLQSYDSAPRARGCQAGYTERSSEVFVGSARQFV